MEEQKIKQDSIYSGIQHIYASQLRGIKEVLDTTYDELLK